MQLELNRNWTRVDTTFGALWVDGALECSTLEDELREIPGRAVAEWKIKHETAIPAGTYAIELVNSPHFGPDTMSLVGVPGFDLIRIHSGEDKDSTDGCIIVGDVVDLQDRTIHGGKAHGVLARLKHKVVEAIHRGEKVFIKINNPPGYAGPDTHQVVA